MVVEHEAWESSTSLKEEEFARAVSLALFDYLRNPGAAVGLYPLMSHGWFLVPSLAAPATASTER